MNDFQFPQDRRNPRGNPRGRRHHDENSRTENFGEFPGSRDAGERHHGSGPHGEKRHHSEAEGGEGRNFGPLDGEPETDGRGFGPRGGGRGRAGFGPGGFGPGFGSGGTGGPGGFGPGGRGFRGGMGGGRGRVRKGNVRSAILSLLSQHSYNGYAMMGAIAIHTDGAWRPSPGSIYPALAALQAEGLIEAKGSGKRTEFELTDTGKAYVAEHVEEMAQVWADVNQEAGAGTDLRLGMGKLVGAVQQMGMAGTEEQIKAATEALDTARRTIYKLLAD